MGQGDNERRRAARAAYAAYVALFWRLHRLPPDHPGRESLVRAVAQADARWRALRQSDAAALPADDQDEGGSQPRSGGNSIIANQ